MIKLLSNISIHREIFISVINTKASLPQSYFYCHVAFLDGTFSFTAKNLSWRSGNETCFQSFAAKVKNNEKTWNALHYWYCMLSYERYKWSEWSSGKKSDEIKFEHELRLMGWKVWNSWEKNFSNNKFHKLIMETATFQEEKLGNPFLNVFRRCLWFELKMEKY